MLFRRFILVTFCVSLAGVALSQMLLNTQRTTQEFAIGERLKEWRMHEAKQACDANPKLCKKAIEYALAV